MAIDPKLITLLDLDVCNFRRLVDALAKDDAWLKVAEFVQIFDRNEISTLSATACPAESLLNEFITKLCTLKTLAVILRECDLYDALAIISGPEPLQIVRQPTDILQGKNKLSVQLGEALELEFVVAGVPPPKFQWFKDDQVLPDQMSAVLRYDRFSPDLEGEYFCCATQEDDLSASGKINSEAVKVQTLPYACTVLEKPDEFVYLCEGSPVFLKLKVVAYPQANFQWLHENKILQSENKNILFFKKAEKRHSGEYRCFVSNKVSEVIIKTNLIIYTENTFQIYRQPVSDKVALLVANEDYTNYDKLAAPSDDVSTLAQILQSFGFKTICLQNLNLHEFKIAIELFADFVKEDSFAFFYYAGHGFEMGDRFLLPTDSPGVSNCKKVDTLPESRVLQRILTKNPILFLFLLDMCLKLPSRSENPAIYEEFVVPCTFTSNRNLIKGFSTTSHLASYERDGSFNGIYINTLKKYLSENLPILTILGNVNAEISSKCPEQMPSIFFNTSQDFYLNNPIKGFYPEENKNYIALNINTEETYINGAQIQLMKFKNVFNNALEITILNAETVEYNVNSSKPLITETIKDNKVILQIKELQRLEDQTFHMQLKVNGIEFTVAKDFEIVNMFLDV